MVKKWKEMKISTKNEKNEKHNEKMKKNEEWTACMLCNRWTDRRTDRQKKWHIEVGAPPKKWQGGIVWIYQNSCPQAFEPLCFFT